MTDRILLSEWAGSTNAPRLLGADTRPACPICGHPSMDCTHDTPSLKERIMAEATSKTSPTTKTGTPTADGKPTGAEKQAQAQVAEQEAVVQTDPTEGGANAEAGLTTAGVGDDAVVLRVGEALPASAYASTDETDPFVTLQKDVMEEFFFPGTKRPSYRLAFTKGQTVRQSAIDAVTGRLAAKPGDKRPEPTLESHIDSSTLASGTGAHLTADSKA